MVSKKSWEKFKREVEGLTKTGVEKESWGKRFHSKDPSDCSLPKRRKSVPEGHSFKAEDDIKGFSSSDEDQPRVLCEPTKTCSFGSKRALCQSLPLRKRKRQKTYSVPDVKDADPVETSRRHTSDPHGAKHVDGGPKKWKTGSCDFENSFTGHLTSPVLNVARDHVSTATLDHRNTIERNEKRIESEDIAWSDSDSEQSVFDDAKNLRRRLSLTKTPFSSRREDLIKLEGKTRHVGDIDEFDSDNGDRDFSVKDALDKKSSPSISPNTPTPTPSSPKAGEMGGFSPLDSAKKKKQKHLRNGLAERLRKLLVRESSEKSFWFHKLRQLKESREDDDQSSRQADGTLTLRMVSDDLDHSVHVIKCDVISQNVISERKLPDQVIVLLDRETRKQLDIKSYLRIYSPWKRFDLPNFSLPVLLCIIHCEALSVLPSHLQSVSRKNVEVSALRNAKQFDRPLAKDVRTRLFAPSVCNSTYGNVCLSKYEENDEQTCDGENKSTEKMPEENPKLFLSLMNSLGLQGQCLQHMIDFAARIQRVYWRSVTKRNQISNCTSCSSLVLSIIERSRVLKQERTMSFCFLVQDSAGFCSEVRLPSNVFLRKTEWHELLCSAEGSIMSFRGLRLVEHRKRKRRHGVFGLIDSLTATTSKERNIKEENSNESSKQNVCFILSIDDSTLVQRLSDDEVNDYPSYRAPDTLTLNDLQTNCSFGHKRVKLLGKLLYATFKTNQHCDTKRVCLFIMSVADNGILVSDPLDVSAEITSGYVFQVQYSSGSSVGWNDSELSAGQLLHMVDLVTDKDKPTVLTADIFSKIQVLISQPALSPCSGTQTFHIDDLWRHTMRVPVDEETCSRLGRLSPTVLPELNGETESDSLVSFEGIIIDVDQTNAFCWFTCNECGSNDISELPENSLYICNSCGLDIRSPVNNMHLEVYLKSITSPALLLKVKLLQSTISRLLPESRSDEGYDVQCVLNKRLGPMSCYVLTKQGDEDSLEEPQISFKLEELDVSCWTH